MNKKLFSLVLMAVCITVLSLFGFTEAYAGEDIIKWKMTSTWTPSLQHIESDRHFIKVIDEMIGDRLNIKFYEGGTLVPPYEVFDTVASGTVDAAGDWVGYWAGKNTAFDALGGLPMVLTPIDLLVWIINGGGFDLYQEVYGKFGMAYLPTAIMPMDSGFRGNKPIRSLDDFKGLKVRAAGQTAGKILQRLQAAQVKLAGDEVYQALEKGVVDAAEMSSPSIDWNLGLQEVTKYWAVPNPVNNGNVLGVMINKKSWDKLPDRLKTALKTAAMANCVWTLSFMEGNAITAVQKFLDKGIKVTSLPISDVDEIQKIANEYNIQSCKENPLFAKVAYSQYKFLKDIGRWREMSTPFSYGSNRPLPDLEQIKACIK